MKLYKREKLCSTIAIGKLFESGKGTIAYPLRVVYRFSDAPRVVNGIEKRGPAQFFISIPKKKIRTAVGRVLLRRRVREAYRLNRDELYAALRDTGKSVDIAIIWLSKSPADFALIQTKLQELLSRIANDAYGQQA